MLQGYHSFKFSLHNYFGKKVTHQKRYLYKIFKKKSQYSFSRLYNWMCLLFFGGEIKIEIRVDGGDESNCNSTKAWKQFEKAYLCYRHGMNI